MTYKAWLFALAVLAQPLILWWYFAPPYLDVYIPLPSYHGDIWDRTQHTTLSYNGEAGVEYVLRRDGTAYADVVGWRSAEDGWRYVDG